MAQDILAIAGAKFQSAQKLDQFRINRSHTGFLQRFFPGFSHFFGQFPLGFFYHFFNPARMDQAVGDQFIYGAFGDLAPDGGKTGNNDGQRRFINNHFHSGQLFNGPNIAALFADNSTLHIFGRDGDDGGGGFRSVGRGAAHNGRGRSEERRVGKEG